MAFVRSFPLTRRTLCTEAPLVWLGRQDAALAEIVPRFDWRVQTRLLAHAGFMGAVREICARIGYAPQPAQDLREGEVIICRDRQRNPLLGFVGPDGRFVGVSHENIVIADIPAILVLRRCEPPFCEMPCLP